MQRRPKKTHKILPKKYFLPTFILIYKNHVFFLIFFVKFEQFEKAENPKKREFIKCQGNSKFDVY